MVKSLMVQEKSSTFALTYTHLLYKSELFSNHSKTMLISK